MKITIYSDYKEEGWKSMDIYTKRLIQAIRLQDSRIFIQEFQAFPSLSCMVSKNHRKMRYLFRYMINPSLCRFYQGEVNHIVDQANAHLLYLLNPKKTIITCHDLIVPFWHRSYGIKQKIKEWRISGLQRAARIIAVSRYTKNMLMDVLSIPSERIVVIPNGIESDFQRVIDKKRIESVKKRFHLPDSYMLHVGTNASQKNIEGIYSFFLKVLQTNPNIYLVKIGEAMPCNHPNIITIPYVSREDLACLYSHARALLHLSYIEGFGLTVLEAMRCGCPVILSNIPPHQELASDIGIFLNLDDIESHVDSVMTMLSDESYRRSYAKKSIERSLLYSWEKTAKQVIDVYKEVFAS